MKRKRSVRSPGGQIAGLKRQASGLCSHSPARFTAGRSSEDFRAGVDPLCQRSVDWAVTCL